MKKILMGVLMVVLAFGVALAKDYEVKKKAGDFDVEVRIDKNPPVVGDNTIAIEVKQAGKAVADAKVLVDYSMPAMPGMPAMNYKTDAELKGNIYKATMNLSMSGPWNIAIKISKAGKTSTAKFSIDAR
ncbi:MAG: FixH family protein [Nitrospirae bacterium]|nr:FixH family protein [Nitrospirota bacterium]